MGDSSKGLGGVAPRVPLPGRTSVGVSWRIPTDTGPTDTGPTDDFTPAASPPAASTAAVQNAQQLELHAQQLNLSSELAQEQAQRVSEGRISLQQAKDNLTLMGHIFEKSKAWNLHPQEPLELLRRCEVPRFFERASRAFSKQVRLRETPGDFMRPPSPQDVGTWEDFRQWASDLGVASGVKADHIIQWMQRAQGLSSYDAAAASIYEELMTGRTPLTGKPSPETARDLTYRAFIEAGEHRDVAAHEARYAFENPQTLPEAFVRVVLSREDGLDALRRLDELRQQHPDLPTFEAVQPGAGLSVASALYSVPKEVARRGGNVRQQARAALAAFSRRQDIHGFEDFQRACAWA